MEKIYIKSEFIKLDQFLKYADIAQTGGHAKILIKDGLVKVNNEVVYERGKKLYKDYIIEVEDKEYILKKED